MSSSNQDAKVYGVETAELEITIAAKAEHVWQALVEETSEWWNRDFYTSTAAKGFVIEPHLGGHAREDWGGGSGQIWYTVIGIEAPYMITMQGLITPEFGGPTQTVLKLTLEAQGASTILRLTDTRFGRVGESGSTATSDGWRLLFEGGLKAHVERPQ